MSRPRCATNPAISRRSAFQPCRGCGRGRAGAPFESEKSDLVNGESGDLHASGPLAPAHFWDVNDPYLYDVYSILTVGGQVVDVCRIRTGFRQIEFKGGAGTGGVWLNGRFLWLTGFAQRSVNDWAGLGQAYPGLDARLERPTRTRHQCELHPLDAYRARPADVRACDRSGILEICPAGDKESDPANDSGSKPRSPRASGSSAPR